MKISLTFKKHSHDMKRRDWGGEYIHRTQNMLEMGKIEAEIKSMEKSDIL